MGGGQQTGAARHLAADELRSLISRVARVSLGEFPTPLTSCERLSGHLGGPKIFMKREDLSGLGLGGNKSRLLEFRLAEAVGLNSDIVVAGLDLQSNSARQLAAGANRLGLATNLLLREDHEPVWQGNLLVDRILGADITFVPVGVDMDAAMRTREAELRERGRTPYVMNHAPMFAVGAALAGLEWTLEAIDQLAASNHRPTHFYLSSGGKCQAGMILAGKATGMAVDVVGLNAHPSGADAVAITLDIIEQTQRCLETTVPIGREDVINRRDHAGSVFGVPNPATVEAISLVARLEGILLDPVFSGKAMAGLIADIRAGRLTPEDTVVFVHTGGVPAIFAHAGVFAS